MNYYRSSVAADQIGTYATTYTHSVEGVTQYGSTYQFFANNTSLTNDNVIIGNCVNNCVETFLNATNFNGNVSIGKNVLICNNMFNGCTNYNVNLTIPNNVQNCQDMLYGCTNFNSNVTFIGNTAKNCANMLYGCRKYNQAINLPEGIANCAYMYDSCTNLNQSVVIPNSATNCIYMFNNCPNMSKDIYFNFNAENVYVGYMLVGRNNSHRINIHYNGLQTNYWNTYMRHMLGSSSFGVATLDSGNGYYNSANNIYFLNDYYPS